MKHADRHLRRAHQGIAYGLIAAAGLVFALVIMRAHSLAAFETERTRHVEAELERALTQASGSTR